MSRQSLVSAVTSSDLEKPKLRLSLAEAQELKQLLESNSAPLALYAKSWCNCPEDAVQDALLELLKQPALPTDTLAWLYQATRWRAMNLARADKRLRTHHDAAQRNRDKYSQDTEQCWIDDEELQAALQELPETSRAIVVARIWGGQTLVQVASALALPTSTVHRYYRKAIAQLGRLLTVSGERENNV